MTNKGNVTSQEKLDKAKKIADKKKGNGFFEAIEEVALRLIRWTSTAIDKLFFTKHYSYGLALVLACVMYFIVNIDSDSFSKTLLSSKTLNNVNVTARYNGESFEVTGLPESCNITITGDAANVNNAATKSGYCLINLEGFTEGTHTVDILATGYGENINTIITPNQATVTLKRKTTGQFDLTYDFINQNHLDSKYILGLPEFALGSTKVNIRASQDTLNSIALVKALIDVSGQTSSFETNAPLVAYNSQGQMVDAEIVPSTVNVKVQISSPHKSVPIKLNITGETPVGFSLESVTMDHQTTEIYAPESVLAEINEVYTSLDLSTITSDSEIIQPVVLPNGVNSSDVTMVNLKATLGTSVTKTIEKVALNSANNENGYGVSYADTLNVSLIITGTQSNVDLVNANDFYTFVDFAGLEPGTYDLPVQVVNNATAYVTVQVNPKNLNITLVNQE
ncbi:MAG: CdaR family protein [Erysipelotrichaceae bacterium]|nr:CdaR family protein [Erysipelotrichaceae bacterium]